MKNLISVWLMIAVIIVGLGPSVLYAGEKDTPESVMQAGKDASVYLAQAQAIASRMQQDRAYAARLLTLVQKQDKEGVIKLFKENVSEADITIEEMGDFCIRVKFGKILVIRFCDEDDCRC